MRRACVSFFTADHIFAIFAFALKSLCAQGKNRSVQTGGVYHCAASRRFIIPSAVSASLAVAGIPPLFAAFATADILLALYKINMSFQRYLKVFDKPPETPF
jgi:hypothetical protein